MLPVLAMLSLEARDVRGFTFRVFLVLLPRVVVTTTALRMTLGYPL
jgi:short subunit fatty acids transporter